MTKILNRLDIMSQNTELTLEQQFQLQVLKTQVKNLTLEESQEYLLEMFRQMMVKDVWIARILKDRPSQYRTKSLKR